jgi:hypothetical protein
VSPVKYKLGVYTPKDDILQCLQLSIFVACLPRHFLNVAIVFWSTVPAISRYVSRRAWLLVLSSRKHLARILFSAIL